MSDNTDLTKALYELKGSVDATRNSTTEKFTQLFLSVDGIKSNLDNLNVRVTKIENNWSWYGKIMAGIGGVAGSIFTLIIGSLIK